MMIKPPIDKLLDKSGCKYGVVCVVAKRARNLLDRRMESGVETSAKAVSRAAGELYSGDIVSRGDSVFA